MIPLQKNSLEKEQLPHLKQKVQEKELKEQDYLQELTKLLILKHLGMSGPKKLILKKLHIKNTKRRREALIKL